MNLKSLKIRFFFAWYDLWIGVYVDRDNQAVYICLLPTLVIKIWKPKPPQIIDIPFTEIKIEKRLMQRHEANFDLPSGRFTPFRLTPFSPPKYEDMSEDEKKSYIEMHRQMREIMQKKQEEIFLHGEPKEEKSNKPKPPDELKDWDRKD